MDQPKTLRVRASGQALVQNYEKLEQGVNAFIARRFEPGKGFVPTGDVEEVPHRAEYVRALMDEQGGLEPADEATANAVGMTLKKKEEKKSNTGSSSSGGK